MNVVEIKGRDLHFIKRVINRHQYNEPFLLESLLQSKDRAQWDESFIHNLEKIGLIRIEDGLLYPTDLAKNSVIEKDKRERKLINEEIIDSYEYAFLNFMHNRNEPVEFLTSRTNFNIIQIFICNQ